MDVTSTSIKTHNTHEDKYFYADTPKTRWVKYL